MTVPLKEFISAPDNGRRRANGLQTLRKRTMHLHGSNQQIATSFGVLDPAARSGRFNKLGRRVNASGYVQSPHRQTQVYRLPLTIAACG